MKGYGESIALEELYHSSATNRLIPRSQTDGTIADTLFPHRHMTLSIIQEIIGSQYSG
jgi:hypothetical protein